MTEFATQQIQYHYISITGYIFKFLNPCQKGKGKFLHICALIEEYQINLERPTLLQQRPLKAEPSTKIYQINWTTNNITFERTDKEKVKSREGQSFLIVAVNMAQTPLLKYKKVQITLSSQNYKTNIRSL
jgi:hypothetical protein